MKPVSKSLHQKRAVKATPTLKAKRNIPTYPIKTVKGAMLWLERNCSKEFGTGI